MRQKWDRNETGMRQKWDKNETEMRQKWDRNKTGMRQEKTGMRQEWGRLDFSGWTKSVNGIDRKSRLQYPIMVTIGLFWIRDSSYFSFYSFIVLEILIILLTIYS